MKYYVNPKKKRIKPAFIFILLILVIANLILYLFDKKVFPYVLQKSESMINARAVDTISKVSMDIFNDEFKYDEIVKIDKDSEGNINLIRADTVKLNKLSSKIALKCNEELQKMGEVGVDVPMSWITDRSIFYNVGPYINVKIKPIGNIKIDYDSKFESAGINQTRHKIYLNVKAEVKIVVPLHSKDVEVMCEIPVSETIIVGKIPDTAIDFSGISKGKE
ncbi:sporulation protein YunB [Clostridium sp. DSM 8431]|uniref:sporulation protein YunB n=1 Tax=Clostridium sp. DSM 8431 TaxID=1761781 RepID=UPI0008E4FAE4|nr:sporulation protein YunB [Clostridium sp. DSM 8431]SFU33844.1 sporulation protein YunB [Clostridium sp. DSM 8431]